jgi:hypothetical protein
LTGQYYGAILAKKKKEKMIEKMAAHLKIVDKREDLVAQCVRSHNGPIKKADQVDQLTEEQLSLELSLKRKSFPGANFTTYFRQKKLDKSTRKFVPIPVAEVKNTFKLFLGNQAELSTVLDFDGRCDSNFYEQTCCENKNSRRN